MDEYVPNSIDPYDLYADDDDDENEQCVEDIEDAEVFSDNESNSSDYIEGEENTLSGE